MENNNHKKGTQVEELLKRIHELEDGHARLKQEMMELMINRQKSNQKTTNTNDEYGGATGDGGGAVRRSAVKLTEAQYLNILQSIDQPVHIVDANGCIIYRNQAWESLYGYTSAETIGKPLVELIIEPREASIAKIIIQQMLKGSEGWSGEFLVRNKRGETFVVWGSNKPFCDENGTIIGIICASVAPHQYQEMTSEPTNLASEEFGIDPQQPLQTAVSSKIFDVVAKVKSKIKKGVNKLDHEGTLRGDIIRSPFGEFFSSRPEEEHSTVNSNMTWKGNEGGGAFYSDSNYMNTNMHRIHKTLSSKVEWMVKNGIAWPWKGNEREGGRLCWHWLHSDQEHEYSLRSQPWEVDNQKAIVSWCCIKENCSIVDCEIKWEDLMIRERIGRGSCGTVYHGLWHGSDVALKLFPKQEYSHDLILSFTHEVSVMKRLRHPNILLFMGTVTSPQRLCIVTEFLHRGSLFRLLHQNTAKLDCRRRVRMAADIARGMNYLHHCRSPIIHCDLKSSNLLVDKNWRVKVGNFGLCRIKHKTFVTRKEVTGTPEWTAPEVLRNEQADEKSDVYSYGVVLWEIITENIPWDGLNSLQVIKAVGFMNQRLDIPKDVHPQLASLIERCLCSEPGSRPTFQEILDELKHLHKFAVQV